MIFLEMNKLEKKLIECLNIRLLKQEFISIQKWGDATLKRDVERISIREFHNILNDTSDDGHNWEVYEKSLKDYCIHRFDIHDGKSILKILDREEKLKQLGI